MFQPINLKTASSVLAFGSDVEPTPIQGYAANSRLYSDLPADAYHGDRDVLSCSTLKPLLVSPAHFQASLRHRLTASKAMDFGSLVHALVLQPHLVGNEFAVYPGPADARAKEYKDFLVANPHRLVVDEPTFSKGRDLAEKILHRQVFGRCFGDFVAEGIPEASIFFEEPTTGIMLKIRPDLFHPEITFDLKTTRYSTGPAFIRHGIELDYDLQSFMYSLGRSLYDGTETPKPFVFIAAESDEPNSINVVTAGSSYLSNGAKKFQEALTVYSACTASGYWPDAGGESVAEIDYWQSFNPRMAWKTELEATASTSVH